MSIDFSEINTPEFTDVIQCSKCLSNWCLQDWSARQWLQILLWSDVLVGKTYHHSGFVCTLEKFIVQKGLSLQGCKITWKNPHSLSLGCQTRTARQPGGNASKIVNVNRRHSSHLRLLVIGDQSTCVLEEITCRVSVDWVWRVVLEQGTHAIPEIRPSKALTRRSVD